MLQGRPTADAFILSLTESPLLFPPSQPTLPPPPLTDNLAPRPQSPHPIPGPPCPLHRVFLHRPLTFHLRAHTTVTQGTHVHRVHGPRSRPPVRRWHSRRLASLSSPTSQARTPRSRHLSRLPASAAPPRVSTAPGMRAPPRR
ncbi:hypothetical protein DAI22_09g117250 [Oryza sativa Japonica Group]|nr:hypothetical protein DAI22_09g117250 [Oryza sativa Japonica Group]